MLESLLGTLFELSETAFIVSFLVSYGAFLALLMVPEHRHILGIALAGFLLLLVLSAIGVTVLSPPNQQ